MPHIGYKTLVTAEGKLCFAVLEIPDDALTNEGRSNVTDKGKAKFRCSKATVIDIHDLDGNPIVEAYSQHDKTFKYTVGQYVESKFDPRINLVCGSGIHYFLSQVIYLLNPEKSKYTGTNIEYYENGQIWCEANYVDGKRHGRYVSYHESGQIKEESNYVDGKHDGRFVHYYDSGQIMHEINYVDGKIHGRFMKYYESGRIYWRSSYINGRLFGRFLEFYEDGQIKKEEDYIGGKLV